ncbi:hypothetical protein N7474_006768 [Penicillium riverlandense]|uniref:uncharacterized protein n=1 Tax=Penicillium riverlandense TaxID=1903569 RepID=UPI002546B830|nr:uncharacterized protein N7474_006768 [Penicillium riverlandense]KAJ5814991.1 hypothetical protein N7474_006768 [Penicillium riverlandense]
MSSQFLQTELANLVQESRRKNADLRNAAEQSLNELKALPSTSEAQISADLARRPTFVDPFIIACHTRHAKLAGIGVICLQRLIASRSLPSARLKDVLEGLKDTTNLSLDIQLKILQSLPSILQFYSSDLSGELLASTLEICATLQASKPLSVSSTAAATLQQLVVSVFERVSTEDNASDDSKTTTTVKVNGNSIEVAQFAFDALQVLDDLCRLIDGDQLRFLRIKSLSPAFVLELIESIVTNSGRLFVGHPELSQVLRVRFIPLAVRYLSERHPFAQTIRVARILLVLLKRHMSLLTAECEMVLGLMIHLLEPDGTNPWKRVLCMEVFRGLYAEPGVVRQIYSLYDGVDGRKNILRDHMASLVKLASEKPSLIGVSNQSTVPTRADHSRSATEDQITLETGGVTGVIGTTAPATETSVSGISTQWSVPRTAYIELLDKTEPPLPPDTYIYGLVLNCISTFAEGLARFILPLTVPDSKQKRKNRFLTPDQGPDSARPSQELSRADSWRVQSNARSKKPPVPVNPLDLQSHTQYSAIKTCASIIDHCWPAVLAACSTFLHASLDDEYYHNLVRAFQKLAHVAGLLRLSVPRDAFLTTLGKAAMPASVGGPKSQAPGTPTPSGSQQSDSPQRRRKSSDLSHTNSTPADSLGASSVEGPSVTLSTRNLLCLRALLNLGIALGPTLDQPAWSILLETLQYSGLVIGMSTSAMVKSASGSGESAPVPGNDVPTANLGAEVIAVQAASTKMFESTSDYPSSSFREILLALLKLSAFTEQDEPQEPARKASDAPGSPQSSRKAGRLHQTARRVSHTVGRSRMQDEELKFVLEKGNELAKANLERLSSLDEEDSAAWQILTQSLISISPNTEISPNLRLQASGILNSLVFLTMKPGDGADPTVQNKIQMRNLQTLKDQIASLYTSHSSSAKSLPITVIEIHEHSLEVLGSILEQYAETLVDGWGLIFDLISGVFHGDPETDQSTPATARRASALPAGPRLVRAAYKSLQLVASDFLSLLPAPCLLSLVNSFSSFASQTQDFNISLTTTSFFWNVSDFLQGQIERFSIESHVDASVSEEELANLAGGEDPSVSRNSLWLLLLLRIVDITTDSRPEIRNSAIHTLLRIFDAYGQQLSPKAWRLCLNRVLFRMVEEIETALFQFKNRQDGLKGEDLKSWVETSVVMIKGVSSLMTNFFEAIVRDEKFDHSWNRLLKYLQALVGLHLLEFSEATFSSLSEILLRAQDSISKDALRCAWHLWADGHPAEDQAMLELDQPNQDAAMAYLRTFQQIYRLYKFHLDAEHIEKVLQHLRLLIWNSVCPRYSPDVDRPSAVQGLVMECIKTLCREKHDSQPAILLCLADLSDSALSKWSVGADSRRPAFVAFSKNAIDLISWYITEFGIKKDIFSNGALATALERLSAPIMQKYMWQGKDREPFLWQKATTTSLNVLQVAVPYVEKQYTEANQHETSRFWQCVVDITHGIVSARGFQAQQLSNTRILADESFDISAFTRLKTLILPFLGAPAIPDSIRRDFACALFHSSFIYAPQRFDLPAARIEEAPLQDFYTIRPGRTFDPPPTLRPKIAYVLIDTLFELASSARDKNPNEPSPHTLLARSISPYLLLRCAVSLKSYIADQPLRGLMPQPTPARKALLHLLLHMVQLKSEPSAIPDPPAIQTVSVVASSANTKSSTSAQHSRRHLEWLYPLVVGAVQVAGKERDDGQVLQALAKVLQELGLVEDKDV